LLGWKSKRQIYFTEHRGLLQKLQFGGIVSADPGVDIKESVGVMQVNYTSLLSQREKNPVDQLQKWKKQGG